jgi:hypothetical protein
LGHCQKTHAPGRLLSRRGFRQPELFGPAKCDKVLDVERGNWVVPRPPHNCDALACGVAIQANDFVPQNFPKKLGIVKHHPQNGVAFLLHALQAKQFLWNHTGIKKPHMQSIQHDYQLLTSDGWQAAAG